MFWDKISPLYDLFEKVYNGKVYSETGAKTAEFIAPTDTVLECACGTGVDTPETSLYYFHGTGPSEMLAKKTAKYLKKHYPTTTVTCFDRKAHCENSLIHPDVMIAELDKIIL